MRARARLGTEHDASSGGRGRTRVRTLRSEWPLMLRTTAPLRRDVISAWASRGADPARLHLAAAAAGPVGGDALHLEVVVGPGSALVLGEVSPTLLLPGPRGERSSIRVDIRVGADATLAWLPQLVIAARGCSHRTEVHVHLDPEARLLLREEVLLGRHGEAPGALAQRLRVTVGDRPLHDQELVLGTPSSGWSGPAVAADHPCLGSLLLVDPAVPEGPRTAGAAAATMPLAGRGCLVTALAPDTSGLRERLDAACADLIGDEQPQPVPAAPARAAR